MFTEVDLFHDCAVKHSDTAPNQALGEHTYAAVWSALRNWMQSLFARCRGAVFPTFARIAWHRVPDHKEDGEPMLRPIFVPGDAYLRVHLLHTGSGITRSSALSAEELHLEPCEEYSAMKIAIKHSCSLNKDVVFSCTRHLLHHMGEALRSGRPVELDLGVGILSGRDRCLSFRFHSQYLAHWPATLASRLAMQSPANRSQRQPPGTLQHQQAGREHQQEQPQLRKLQVERVAENACWAGSVSAPKYGSGGGSSDCTDDRAVVEGDGGNEGAWRGVGGAIAPGPISSGRGEHLQSCKGNDNGEQQRGRQRGRSPGPGADRDTRQPVRDSGPSSARVRPAWGARVPPPRPVSPGRCSAAAAVHSPKPHVSTAAVNSAAEASGLSRSGTTSGQTSWAHMRQQHQQKHCHHYFHRHEHLSQDVPDGLIMSPKFSAGGADTCNVKFNSDGTAAAMAEAMPVARAVHLSVRTPGQRHTSPTPHPQASTPDMNQRNQQHRKTAQSMQACPNIALPLSAPRGRHLVNQIDGPMSPDDSTRRVHLASPRLDGGAAGPTRPPWGSGYGARARASAGDSPNAMRPQSAPRLRPGVAASEAAASAAKPTTVEAMAGETRHWSRTAWTGGGGSSGGGASGLDVQQQLWSPDNNLTTAAGVRGGRTGGGRVRRLFGSAGCSPSQETTCNGGDGVQIRSAASPQRLKAQPVAQVLQQPHANNAPRASCTPELDDHVTSDQQKLPQRLQQRNQHVPVQQPRGQGARKLLFLSPQKDTMRCTSERPAAERAVIATFGRGQEVKSQTWHPAGGEQPLPATGVMATEAPVSCDEPDNSPQLRRDQSSKSVDSPEHKKSVTPAANPPRAIVRTLSPRMETQQYNLRYGTSVGAGHAIATERSARGERSGCSGSTDIAVTVLLGAGARTAAGVGPGVGPVGSSLEDGSLVVARCDSKNNGPILASPSRAVAPPAVAWDRDVSLTGSARATVAQAPLVSAPGLQEARVSPTAKTPGLYPAAGKTACCKIHDAGAPNDEGDTNSSGGSSTKNESSSTFGSSGGTDGGEGLSSSGGAVHSSENLTEGYPLPMYNHNTDVTFRDNSDGDDGVHAMPGLTSRCRPTPTPATAFAITSTVQAALSRNHRAGGADWIYQSDASHNSNSSGESSTRGSSMMQLAGPQPDRDFNLVLSPRKQPGPVFPVPMIISEADLPEPAWGTVPRLQDGDGSDRGSHTSNGGDPAGGYTYMLVNDGGRMEAVRNRDGAEDGEVESVLELEPEGVVACSAASSADICWSARSGRGQDSTIGARGGGRGRGPLLHRRACGGALDLAESADCEQINSPEPPSHLVAYGETMNVAEAAISGGGNSGGRRRGVTSVSRAGDSQLVGSPRSAMEGAGDADDDFQHTITSAGHYMGLSAATTATSTDLVEDERSHRIWAAAAVASVDTHKRQGLTDLISINSSMPLMGSRCDGEEKEEYGEHEEEDDDHRSGFACSKSANEDGDVTYDCVDEDSSSSFENTYCYSRRGCLVHNGGVGSRGGLGGRGQLTNTAAGIAGADVGSGSQRQMRL